MKILLFGASGLLGNAIFDVFRHDHEITAPPHSECDIEKLAEIERTMRKVAPDIIINAAGYTHVDLAETEHKLAKKLNVDAVGNVAMCALSSDVPLVHFSTDYVFDGKKEGGYDEKDCPSALSVYGSTKAAGEKVIMESLTKYFIIRTSWLFGKGGKNFVDRVIEAHHKNKDSEIKVVADQCGCPTYSLDCAQALLHLLKSSTYGIYHIVNTGSCSWYEYAAQIFHQLGMPQKLRAITTRECARPAARPHCSVLNNTKTEPLRHWREALAHYLMRKTIII